MISKVNRVMKVRVDRGYLHFRTNANRTAQHDMKKSAKKIWLNKRVELWYSGRVNIDELRMLHIMLRQDLLLETEANIFFII